MHSCGVLFELRHAETRHGEVVRVVGNLPELAEWDVYKSEVRLQTGAGCYPLWAMLAPVQLKRAVWNGSSPGSFSTPPPSPQYCREQMPGSREDTQEEDLLGATVTHQARSSTDDSALVPLQLEYKYVKDRRQVDDRGPSIQWESSIANRTVTIPWEPGSIWIVSDAGFNDSRERARLTRTSLTEVIARQNTLGMSYEDYAPEWTGREQEDDDRSTLTSTSRHTDSTIGMLHL
mmetsp:Transcript_34957/g.96650  ORF Transcript_34957/g.96650 Transcript_34957/m.96650 type:complete len:233 (-) Transcript_34957:300-998(-)